MQECKSKDSLSSSGDWLEVAPLGSELAYEDDALLADHATWLTAQAPSRSAEASSATGHSSAAGTEVTAHGTTGPAEATSATGHSSAAGTEVTAHGTIGPAQATGTDLADACLVLAATLVDAEMGPAVATRLSRERLTAHATAAQGLHHAPSTSGETDISSGPDPDDRSSGPDLEYYCTTCEMHMWHSQWGRHASTSRHRRKLADEGRQAESG